MSEGKVYTRKRGGPLYLVLTAISAGVMAIVSFLGAIAIPIVPGVSAFYPAVILMTCFSLWFGGWGILASGIGGTIGVAMSGVPIAISIALSFVADASKGFVPCLMFKAFKADCTLKNRRSLAVWIGAIIVEPFIGSIWYITGLYWLGWIPSLTAWWLAIWGWWLDEWILLIIVGTVFLRLATPLIDRLGLLVFPKRWW